MFFNEKLAFAFSEKLWSSNIFVRLKINMHLTIFYKNKNDCYFEFAVKVSLPLFFCYLSIFIFILAKKKKLYLLLLNYYSLFVLRNIYIPISRTLLAEVACSRRCRKIVALPRRCLERISQIWCTHMQPENARVQSQIPTLKRQGILLQSTRERDRDWILPTESIPLPALSHGTISGYFPSSIFRIARQEGLRDKREWRRW